MTTKTRAPHLETQVTWAKTEDPHCPWKATTDGEKWVLRLGDYPAEDLYALLVNGAQQLTINSWPECWTKEGVHPVPGPTDERLEQMRAELDELKKEVTRLTAFAQTRAWGGKEKYATKKFTKVKKGLRSRGTGKR